MPTIFLLLALTSFSLGVDLASVGSIPANTLDSLGETAGGYGSGSAYDPKAGLLYLTSDRGPGDGTIDYSPPPLRHPHAPRFRKGKRKRTLFRPSL